MRDYIENNFQDFAVGLVLTIITVTISLSVSFVLIRWGLTIGCAV